MIAEMETLNPNIHRFFLLLCLNERAASILISKFSRQRTFRECSEHTSVTQKLSAFQFAYELWLSNKEKLPIEDETDAILKRLELRDESSLSRLRSVFKLPQEARICVLLVQIEHLDYADSASIIKLEPGQVAINLAVARRLAGAKLQVNESRGSKRMS